MAKKGSLVSALRVGEQVALINQRVKKKPNALFLILIGIAMNVMGAGLLYYKSQMDKDVIQHEIDKKLSEYGIGINGTAPLTMEEIEELEPSSIILVLVTMLGRIVIVVGTIKLFKGLDIFISERRKKKLKETAERLQNGETEADWTEIFGECCAF